MEDSTADSTLLVSADAMEGDGTADCPLESYPPQEATQELQAKAQLKSLLRMATSFGSHMECGPNPPAESNWGGLDGVGDAMCFGLTSPLQGTDAGGRSQGSPAER